MSTVEVVDNILLHYGKKGMKWGVRKGSDTSTSTSSGTSVKGIEHYSKAQAASMSDVATKVKKAYGLKIDEFIPLTDRQNKRGIAYVDARSKGSTVVHMSTKSDLKKTLTSLEKKGWFVPSGGRPIESILTHESAHALFHQTDIQGKAFRKTTVAPAMDTMRNSAWTKAKAQAEKDGHVVPGKGLRKLITDSPQTQMGKKLSTYAHATLWIEETEAEIFTAYHWSPNPPKFVDAFMNDVHKSMGKKVKPFSGREG